MSEALLTHLAIKLSLQAPGQLLGEELHHRLAAARADDVGAQRHEVAAERVVYQRLVGGGCAVGGGLQNGEVAVRSLGDLQATVQCAMSGT
mgnify:CR=1 FL=1